MSAVIELKNIKKQFGNFEAVKDMDLAIQKGELVSFLGPSGCGKTTTLRMIAGFETPTEGSIFLNGRDINNVPARLRNLTMVFQNYALFPHMTVFQNIAFGLNMRKADKAEIKKKVDDLLQIVKLAGFEKRLPSQLSGGQQQRVALARALITNPEVLLLDEPFGALDKKLREAMQLEIRNILKTLNITAIFVTHDQEEALVLSDKVVVMNNGKIEQMGTPKETYEFPQTKFAANFIGVSNIIEGEFKTDERKGSYMECRNTKLYFDGGQVEHPQVLAIRPEWVELHMGKAEAENSLDGVIADVKYFGNNVQYFVDAKLPEPVIVSCPNTDGYSSMKRGIPVTVAFPRQALRAIQD